MKSAVRNSSLIFLATIAIALLVGSMLGPGMMSAAGRSSKKSDKRSGGAVFLPTAFEVKAADPVTVNLGGFAPDASFILEFSHSRTPIVVSDPTTGEAIDDLFDNNFEVEQVGALQFCRQFFTGPPSSGVPFEAFEERPFELAIENLGNGFYMVTLLPTTQGLPPGHRCVGSPSSVGLLITVRDGIREGRTAGAGQVIGPFCSFVSGPCPNFWPEA